MSDPNPEKTFQEEFDFETRKAESTRIREKYPDRIPVVVERAAVSTDVPELDKKKFLIPNNLTMSSFMYVVRKRIKLTPEQALFMFVNDVVAPANALMSVIYEEHKDDDGFVYFKYSGENTFGGVWGTE